jgi:hypothetical protein
VGAVKVNKFMAISKSTQEPTQVVNGYQISDMIRLFIIVKEEGVGM